MAALAVHAFLLAAAHGAAPIFTVESDELWLNLHHFLYVLGRAEANMRDAPREAVAGAPADAARGLATLTEAEQRAWREAVNVYASVLSRKDLIFDDPLPALTNALARIDDAATLAPAAASAVDARTRAALERAAPIYRKTWWPAHRDGNRGWQRAVQPLIDRHGQAVLAYIARAYGLPWPSGGYPVHLSAYANWAGAYSTRGELLVVATTPGAGRPDLLALESVFHEGMHQWDDAIDAALDAQARRSGVQVPQGLSHAMIFYTAGEAVRRVAPDHVPYAEASGVWSRGAGAFRPALVEVWQPYLDGRGRRDEALAALIRRTARPADARR